MLNKKILSITFLTFITLFSVLVVSPTIFDLKEDSGFPFKNKINLGLDLQGGLYMIMGIDFEKVYRDEVSNLLKKAVDDLKDQGISASLGEMDLSDPEDPLRSVIIEKTTEIEEAKDRIKDYFALGGVRLGKEEGNVLTYGIHHLRRDEIESESVSKSIEVIRNRIDEFGVTEPEILSQGNDRIVVQLPGVKDVDRAKELIGKTAKLEFKLLDNSPAAGNLYSLVEKAKKENNLNYTPGTKFSTYVKAMNEALAKELPKDTEVAFEKTFNAKGEVISLNPFLLKKESPITGDDLQDALVQFDPQEQRPYVALNFKTKGAEKFAKLTEENVGRPMAIVLDGNVYSAPTIQEKISGGRAQISMGRGRSVQDLSQEASDLALILRAGALPVQLDFQEQRVVGPQLGQDSIEKARKASVIGLLGVFLFLLFYYRFSGFLALVCLSLNVIFVLACLVGLEATLTLPGIAGIALTVGMAVDASIIIYERMREELRKGHGPSVAQQNGFSSAFWTILDANITTALAGICLFQFGTGPIRGFAVTLLIGIVATVYTSYFVGKLFFQLTTQNQRETLSI